MEDYSSVMRILGPMYAVCAVLGIFVLVAMWKLYLKAKEPGWAVIIPFYNIIVMLRIVSRPWWWLLLMLIPFVNIVILIIVSIDMAKSFGKGGAWGFFLLVVLGIIGYPILAFGKSEYKKIQR